MIVEQFLLLLLLLKIMIRWWFVRRGVCWRFLRCSYWFLLLVLCYCRRGFVFVYWCGWVIIAILIVVLGYIVNLFNRRYYILLLLFHTQFIAIFILGIFRNDNLLGKGFSNRIIMMMMFILLLLLEVYFVRVLSHQ